MRILVGVFGIVLSCCSGLQAADPRMVGAIPHGFSGRVDLSATDRAPGAKATANIRIGGGAAVELSLSHLQPATLFGGDFNTYVVWRISSGHAANVGEVQLDGDSARLSFPATADPFAIIVTAEPHYLVEMPSRFVILESPGERSMSYRTEVTPYNFRRDTLDALPAAKNKVVTDVRQAVAAVRLARRTHSQCESELSDAQQGLDKTLELARMDADSEKIRRQARETIKLAAFACREE